MAMMISKFHKLIQSKVVWYIILGVIIIAFVGFFTPSMGSGSKRPDSKAVGELFGKMVTSKEYHSAYQNTFIWYIFSSGSMPQMTDELKASFQEEAWRRLAALRKAEVEEIIVTDEEVVRQIQQLPAFRGETGVYDSRIYKAILQQLQISSAQVEALFREQIGLHKLMARPAQAALISPHELRRAYHVYTDRFVLNYAVFPREQIEKEVSVSREEAERLFAENTEAFRMPSKVRVSYVEWSVADFLDQPEIPEGAALQVYNQNIDNYRIESTGDVAAVEYKPFEDVEEEINTQIRQVLARRLAAEEATALVAEIAPKSEGDHPDFSGAATAAGLAVKTLPAFGLTDELSGIHSPAAFRQAAFRLQDDVYSSFSDAIVGKDNVYVLSLEQRYPSFLPEFDVVEARVMAAARAEAVAKAMTTRSAELEDEITASLSAGNSIEEALKPYSLDLETTVEFDLTTSLDNEYANLLIPICLNTVEGELCRPVPMKEGILIAYVAQRVSTDIEIGLPAVRQELISGLTQNRSRQLAEEWQDSLLREANFKNLMAE